MPLPGSGLAKHGGARGESDPGGRVAAVVVDDVAGGVRQGGLELLEHGADRRFLVEARDDHRNATIRLGGHRPHISRSLWLPGGRLGSAQRLAP